MHEVRLAFKICWTVITVVTISMLIAPGLLSADRMDRLIPKCERKTKTGQECLCCGMTTAFVQIAHGQFSGAVNSNRGSVPLYAGFFCNGLGFLGKMTFTLARSRRLGNASKEN